MWLLLLLIMWMTVAAAVIGTACWVMGTVLGGLSQSWKITRRWSHSYMIPFYFSPHLPWRKGKGRRKKKKNLMSVSLLTNSVGNKSPLMTFKNYLKQSLNYSFYIIRVFHLCSQPSKDKLAIRFICINKLALLGNKFIEGRHCAFFVSVF